MIDPLHVPLEDDYSEESGPELPGGRERQWPEVDLELEAMVRRAKDYSGPVRTTVYATPAEAARVFRAARLAVRILPGTGD